MILGDPCISETHFVSHNGYLACCNTLSNLQRPALQVFPVRCQELSLFSSHGFCEAMLDLLWTLSPVQCPRPSFRSLKMPDSQKHA